MCVSPSDAAERFMWHGLQAKFSTIESVPMIQRDDACTPHSFDGRSSARSHVGSQPTKLGSRLVREGGIYRAAIRDRVSDVSEKDGLACKCIR